MIPVKEIRLSQFDFTPVSMYLGGYKPGVLTSRDGYMIRILKGSFLQYFKGGHIVTNSYDYFEVDHSGLITKAPRGLARFKNRVRILDIAEHADKVPS